MTEPLISIIVPTYQGEKTIKQCLDSIFAQTFSSFEVIVIDDGSTDNTGSILQSYQPKIKLIKQKNSGNANIARNRGIQNAAGQYLLFCDDDIITKPDLLAKMVTALKNNPDKSYAYSSFYFGWKKFPLWPFSATKLRQLPYIHTCSLIRREHFPSFDEKINKLQDWDLWLTLLAAGHTGTWIPEFLFKVQPKKEGISSWLPSVVYKIPWNKFGIKIKSLEKYKKAEEIIRNKHKL
ncbi:glycosyltransferase family 2 protein [Patescibacteria group bacterium]|nr:glycosyltransferase family 2 protein [Patescibacteria group bacterium]